MGGMGGVDRVNAEARLAVEWMLVEAICRMSYTVNGQPVDGRTERLESGDDPDDFFEVYDLVDDGR